MLSFSTVNSHQVSTTHKEITTSTKTVHLSDVSVLKKALKNVSNQVNIFSKNINNPIAWQRPDGNSLERMLVNLHKVRGNARQLLGRIETSSYLHHASKRADLEKISAKIDVLRKSVETRFEGSRQKAQFTRETEYKHSANRTENAQSRLERQQQAAQLINAGRGDELYNGGMVK